MSVLFAIAMLVGPDAAMPCSESLLLRQDGAFSLDSPPDKLVIYNTGQANVEGLCNDVDRLIARVGDGAFLQPKSAAEAAAEDAIPFGGLAGIKLMHLVPMQDP